jgi:formiminoglutamase
MNPDNFTLYSVPIDDMVLVFRKSKRTGRWWIEMPNNNSLNNKLPTTALLPCTYDDYLSATEQNIPERWLKARLRNKV